MAQPLFLGQVTETPGLRFSHLHHKDIDPTVGVWIEGVFYLPIGLIGKESWLL